MRFCWTSGFYGFKIYWFIEFVYVHFLFKLDRQKVESTLKSTLFVVEANDSKISNVHLFELELIYSVAISTSSLSQSQLLSSLFHLADSSSFRESLAANRHLPASYRTRDTERDPQNENLRVAFGIVIWPVWSRMEKSRVPGSNRFLGASTKFVFFIISDCWSNGSLSILQPIILGEI